ncbi:MAG: aspartate aminotransferase [Firmicutes bacterium]|nr:aspartate aminotransferase [Bacillota bacterium]MCL5063947.1 aspartate aminotransferase [Bacillota bacterium]
MSKMAEELYQEGRQEGKRDQTLVFARKLLALGESVEKVAALTELSLDDVQKLRATQA